jgi:hypothetical protein
MTPGESANIGRIAAESTNAIGRVHARDLATALPAVLNAR